MDIWLTPFKLSASIACMLKIRLQRVGRKHEPVFRVVLTDSKNGPKSGKFIEILGSYDSRDKNETTLKADRITHWINNGAQVSDTIHNLLITKEIIKGKKINNLPTKSPVVDEEAIAKEKAEAEAKKLAEEKARKEAEELAKAEAEAIVAEEEVVAEEVVAESEETVTEEVSEEKAE